MNFYFCSWCGKSGPLDKVSLSTGFDETGSIDDSRCTDCGSKLVPLMEPEPETVRIAHRSDQGMYHLIYN